MRGTIHRRLLFQSNRRNVISLVQFLSNTLTCHENVQRPHSLRVFSSERVSEEETMIPKKNTVKRPLSYAKAYAELAKAKLSALVVTTTGAGFLAAGQPFDPSQLKILSACLIGTSLCSASAAALNQIIEVDRDSRMKRTQQRPLVGTGKRPIISKPHALTAAMIWGLTGTGLLFNACDPVTAALGAANIGLYAGVYTYMKPVSIYNTWVGAIVGAIPPVMGYSAAMAPELLCDPMPAVMLGGLLYLWQMPHFFALSFMYREDYKRGGFKMVPCLEEDGDKTSQLVLRYTIYQSMVPFATTLTNVTSSMFAFEGLVLNAYALNVAIKFRRERTNANARRVFLTSLGYLPCWLMLFLLHSKSWDREGQRSRAVGEDWLIQQVHTIRNRGREYCIHEQAKDQHEATVDAMEESSPSCPVMIGAEKQKVVKDALSIVAASNTAAVASSDPKVD